MLESAQRDKKRQRTKERGREREREIERETDVLGGSGQYLGEQLLHNVLVRILNKFLLQPILRGLGHIFREVLRAPCGRATLLSICRHFFSVSFSGSFFQAAPLIKVWAGLVQRVEYGQAWCKESKHPCCTPAGAPLGQERMLRSV